MSSLTAPGVTDEQLDTISKEVARMQLHGCLSPAAINVDVLAGLIERIRTERARTDHLLTVYNKAAESLRAAEKDAARYRWLRDRVGVDFAYGDFMTFLPAYVISEHDKENTDAAIDLAQEQQP